MSEPDPRLGLILGVLAAGLFVAHVALSIVLMSASNLSRVALRRLAAEMGARYAFVERLSAVDSAHLLAGTLLRRGCLLGGTLSLFGALTAEGLRYGRAIGLAAAVLLAVILFEYGVARSLALWDPRRVLRRVAFLLRPSYAVLLPLALPLRALTRRVEGQPSESEESDEEQDEEVEAFIEVGEREGILEGSEGRMMRSIVDLDETDVREIMTPRTDIVALPVTASVGEARGVLLRAGHSRVPVFRGTLDDVVGILHVRDLLRAWEEQREQDTVEGYLREAMFVPESRSVAELLADMRVKTHLVLVIDEYGGVAGLVSLEDVLEEIVGDIRDEHDPDEEEVRQEPGGAFLIDAATHVEELTDLFGIGFEERDFDTVGGLVVSEIGRVPTETEIVTVRGLQFEIVKADRRRVRLVRVRRAAADDVRAAP